MTATHPDLAALLAAVRRSPNDDTPRLVLADWLDEHADTVPCPECGDSAGALAFSLDEPGEPAGWCLRCHGTGTVSDGSAERAELIRVQCELARHDEFTADAVSDPLLIRQRELLTDDRRREWARVPWGTDDAFGLRPLASPQTREGRASGRCHEGQAAPHFRRGFVERVEVPALSWLFERYVAESVYGYSPEYAWRVTPWALAVAAAHPVTEWVTSEPESPVQELPPTVFHLWAEGRELLFALADVVRAEVLAAWARDSRSAQPDGPIRG